MRTSRFYSAGSVALIVAMLGVIACEKDPPVGPNSDASVDASLDASVIADADASLGDGAVDAWVGDGGPPPSTQYDFCALPFFKLPIDGSITDVIACDIWGDRFVTSRYTGLEASEGRNVFVFDFSACVEYKLTENANAVARAIREDIVIWEDKSPVVDPPENYCNTVYLYDLGEWSRRLLFSKPFCTNRMATNGEVLVFRQGVESSQSYYSLNRYHLADQTIQEIVPAYGPAPFYDPFAFDLHDRQLVFAARYNDPQAIGSDIFYYDVETGVATHVATSLEEYQYSPRIWGDWAIWESSYWSVGPPHRQVLYNLGTGEERVVIDNDGSATHGVIHQSLVAYTTSRYAPQVAMYPADMELYDIDSGVYRRITTEPGNLRAVELFFPWLVAAVDLGIDAWHQDWYVLNLVALGLVDEQGHVIEGGPVVDQPAP
jgi:hypothetical protein